MFYNLSVFLLCFLETMQRLNFEDNCFSFIRDKKKDIPPFTSYIKDGNGVELFVRSGPR